ncbi:MAG: GAF domain-containing protein [Anaerolineae bacterium]|nr:GAF domain-containing protein [Anaerolineae bacterium]
MNIFARLASIPLRIKIALLAVLGIAVMVLLAVRAIAAYDALSQPAASVITEVVGKERSALLTEVATRLTGNVRRVSSDPKVGESLAQAAVGQRNVDTLAAALDTMRAVLNLDPAIKHIHLTTADGSVILAAPAIDDVNDADAQWYLDLKVRPIQDNSIYMGRFQLEGTPTFNLVAQVIADSKLVGYVVANVDPAGQSTAASVFDALETVNYSNGSVVFYLIDANAGNTVDSPFAPASSSATDSASSAQALLTRFFSSFFSRSVQLPSPLTGQSTYLYAANISSFNKWLVAESRTVQLAAPTDFSQFILPQVGIVAVGIALLALYLFFLEVSIIRPANALRMFARRVAEGRDLGKVQNVAQNDEIGDIATSLNVMSTQLFQNVQTLQIQLAESVRDIEATREIGQIISSIRDLDSLLGRVVELIRQRFPHIYHAQVFLIDDRGQYAELRVATGDPQDAKLRAQRIAVGSRDLIGRVTAEGRALAGSEGMVMPFAHLPETRAELVLPLRSKADIIGALDLHSLQPDAFAEEDLRLFQSVADQLAIAIVNAQLFEESQARLREIETLNRQFLGEAWRTYTNARRQRIGSDEMEQWSSLQKRAVESGELVEELNSDNNTVTIAIPIKLRGVVLGAVECDMPRESYNENVQLLALELTNRLAITADNARLFERTVRATEREALINEISSKLTQQTEVAEILQTAVRELGQALRVPQTAIRLTAPRRIN